MRLFHNLLYKLTSKLIFEVKGAKTVNHLEKNSFKQHNSEDTVFKTKLRDFTSKNETKSNNLDYVHTIQLIYNPGKIEKGIKLTEEQAEKNREERKRQKEIYENANVQEEKIKSSYFNEFSLKLLENMEIKNLIDLALISQVGNTDIPKDAERTSVILHLAKSKCRDENDKKDVNFFLEYFGKHIDAETFASRFTQDDVHLFNEKSDYRLKYVQARHLFKLITENLIDEIKQIPIEEKNFYLNNCFEIFLNSSEKGIYEAYFFLGLMYLNGYYVDINLRKSFLFFSKAASNSHSLAYYELYKLLRDDVFKIYSNNQEDDLKKKKAMYEYLKWAAYEGYPEAQHEFGLQLIKGEICKKNSLLSIAWLRQSCRNGNIVSYEPAGDAFYNGGENLPRNKELSLVMYYTAYMKGLAELQVKIIKVRDELVKEGYPVDKLHLFNKDNADDLN